MRFSLRQLRVFATLAHTEHFGRAAEALGLSQPTVSADIRSLERALRVELFVRSRAGTSLTEAGTTLLPLAEQVLAGAEELGAEAERLTRTRHLVRLAATPSLVNRLVPTLLHTLEAGESGLQLEVVEVPTGGVPQALAAREADVGVGHFLAEAPGTRRVRVAGDEMCVLSAGGDLDPTVPVDLGTLADRKLLIWPRAQHEEYYDAVRQACRDRGLDPQVLESSSRFSGSRSYHLTIGEAFSLVPFDFAHETSRQLSYAPLDPPWRIPLHVAWTLPAAPGVTELVDVLARLRRGGRARRRTD